MFHTIYTTESENTHHRTHTHKQRSKAKMFGRLLFPTRAFFIRGCFYGRSSFSSSSVIPQPPLSSLPPSPAKTSTLSLEQLMEMQTPPHTPQAPSVQQQAAVTPPTSDSSSSSGSLRGTVRTSEMLIVQTTDHVDFSLSALSVSVSLSLSPRSNKM